MSVLTDQQITALKVLWPDHALTPLELSVRIGGGHYAKLWGSTIGYHGSYSQGRAVLVRLEKRGLVERVAFGMGWRLTPAGRSEVEARDQRSEAEGGDRG